MTLLQQMPPYTFLQMLTSMSTKEWYEVSWHPGSRKTGQSLYSGTMLARGTYIRAIQGHSPRVVNAKHLSHKKVEGHTTFLYHLWTSMKKKSIMSDGILPGGKDHESYKDKTK